MPFSINKKNGIPLYIQLKNQIKELIREGIWEAGSKIPTERELAEMLRISRNTVSTAYKELETEGFLISFQGRGTFVTDVNESFRHGNRKERILRVIDLAIEEAISEGFELEEFLFLTEQRCREKKKILENVKAVFVECNREQLDYFAKELELGSGVTVYPVMITELRDKPQETKELFAAADIIVTTFFHIKEVNEFLKGTGREALGIALDPQMETIVKIARIPKGKTLGLVCLSENFVERVRRSIELAGISDLKIISTVSRDKEEVKKIIASADYIIVSPGRKKEIEKLAPDREIIEFIYVPDAGSINLLKSTLLSIKKGANK